MLTLNFRSVVLKQEKQDVICVNCSSSVGLQLLNIRNQDKILISMAKNSEKSF